MPGQGQQQCCLADTGHLQSINAAAACDCRDGRRWPVAREEAGGSRFEGALRLLLRRPQAVHLLSLFESTLARPLCSEASILCATQA